MGRQGCARQPQNGALLCGGYSLLLQGGVCAEAMSLPFLSPSLPLFSSLFPNYLQVASANLKEEIALLCYSESTGTLLSYPDPTPDSSQTLQGGSVARQQSHCLYFATSGKRVKRVRKTAWWTGGTAVLGVWRQTFFCCCCSPSGQLESLSSGLCGLRL